MEDKLVSLGEDRSIARKRIEDIVGRLGKDLTNDQAIGMLTTMQLLAEFKGKTDGLTGIYNVKAFNEASKKLDSNKDTKFSLVIFDIDDFKNFNEVYGHRIGDQVLIHVVNAVKKNLRSTDFFARYGGDEFALILPIETRDDLNSFCQKIRDSVVEMEGFTSGFSETRGVTISIGGGLYNHTEGFDKFFKKVDKGLKEAKVSGKNAFTIVE